MKFFDGELLQSIIFLNDDMLVVGDSCEKLVVAMENGQSAPVPWIEVFKHGRTHSKWNASLIQGVGYQIFVPDSSAKQ